MNDCLLRLVAYAPKHHFISQFCGSGIWIGTVSVILRSLADQKSEWDHLEGSKWFSICILGLGR